MRRRDPSASLMHRLSLWHLFFSEALPEIKSSRVTYSRFLTFATYHNISSVTHSSCINMSLAIDNPSLDPSSPTTQPPQPESSNPIANPMPAAEANPNGPQGSASNAVEPTAAGPDEGSGDLQGPRGSTSAPREDGVPAEEQNGNVVAKKKRKKRKKAGTSMPKSRGTGFEGAKLHNQVHLVPELTV